MYKIIWSERALNDIVDIADFIARDSKKYATLTTKNIVYKCEDLKNFPRKGKKIEEFKNESIREIIVGNYRVIYNVEFNDINILTIHHSARSLAKRRIL